MDTFAFKTSGQFVQWAKRVVKYKYQTYDRVPVGKQRWAYGDGYIAETEWGERGGTMLSNLGYIVRIANGDLHSPRDTQLIKDIDARQGVVLTVSWGE